MWGGDGIDLAASHCLLFYFLFFILLSLLLFFSESAVTEIKDDLRERVNGEREREGKLQMIKGQAQKKLFYKRVSNEEN